METDDLFSARGSSAAAAGLDAGGLTDEFRPGGAQAALCINVEPERFTEMGRDGDGPAQPRLVSFAVRGTILVGRGRSMGVAVPESDEVVVFLEDLEEASFSSHEAVHPRSDGDAPEAFILLAELAGEHPPAPECRLFQPGGEDTAHLLGDALAREDIVDDCDGMKLGEDFHGIDEAVDATERLVLGVERLKGCHEGIGRFRKFQRCLFPPGNDDDLAPRRIVTWRYLDKVSALVPRAGDRVGEGDFLLTSSRPMTSSVLDGLVGRLLSAFLLAIPFLNFMPENKLTCPLPGR